MKIIFTVIVLITLVLGGLGSIILLDQPILGMVFIALGVLGGLISYVQNEVKLNSLKKNLEFYDQLLITKGIGHPLLIKVKKELASGKSYKKVAPIVDKIISEDPKNLEAISIKLSAYVNGMILNPSSFGDFDYYYNSLSEKDRLQFNNLVELAQFAVKNNKEDYHYYAYLGILLNIKGEHENARKQYRISLKLSKNDKFWRLVFSNTYNRTTEHEKALKEVRAVTGDINFGWLVNYYLGRAYYLVGNYKVAAFYLECARGEAWTSHQIMLLLQDIYYFLNKTKNSIVLGFMISTVYMSVSFRKAMREFLRTIGVILIHIMNLLVIWLWNKTKNKKFIKGLNKKLSAETIFITRAEVVMMRGDNYGYLSMAKFLLNEALKYSPKEIKTWKYLLVIFEKMNDHKKALLAMQKIEKFDPDNPKNLKLKDQLVKGKIKSAKKINFFET